jgi:hypothetical protein
MCVSMSFMGAPSAESLSPEPESAILESSTPPKNRLACQPPSTPAASAPTDSSIVLRDDSFPFMRTLWDDDFEHEETEATESRLALPSSSLLSPFPSVQEPSG